jgi:hypothetical protein
MTKKLYTHEEQQPKIAANMCGDSTNESGSSETDHTDAHPKYSSTNDESSEPNNTGPTLL